MPASLSTAIVGTAVSLWWEAKPVPEFLMVRNWDRFQHYRDRTPRWIKVYNDLLSDYSYACLPDATKAHLIGIWLLASRNNNKLPADPEWIARQIAAKEPVDLERLLSEGWLVPWFDPEEGASTELEAALSTKSDEATQTLAAQALQIVEQNATHTSSTRALARERVEEETTSASSDANASSEAHGEHELVRIEGGQPPEVRFGLPPTPNGQVSTNGQVGNRLIAWWEQRHPGGLPDSAIKANVRAAHKIASDYTPEQINWAIKGMELYLWPYAAPPNGNGQGWNLRELRKHFSRAMMAFLKNDKRYQRLAEDERRRLAEAADAASLRDAEAEYERTGRLM